DIQIDTKWGKWKNRCRNSEQIITNLNQNIFNLQQQILALNNNPQNMATVIECSNVIAPSLATIPEYIGQEHPDTWYERITKLFLHPIIDGNVNFTDAHKVSVLSSKMAGPYHPVPAQNAYVNPAVNIDTPARFNAWLLSKYAEENIGGMTMGIQALLSEKFSPF
ncbi:14522_t:CDS:1, partial [Entrophospora sp. SA101]